MVVGVGGVGGGGGVVDILRVDKPPDDPMVVKN